jgi:hypothetical protein
LLAILLAMNAVQAMAQESGGLKLCRRDRIAEMDGRKSEKTTDHSHPDGDASQCEFCQNNTPFEIPEGLYKSLLSGQIVLFAGAGISTEGRTSLLPDSLFQEVCSDLSIEPSEAPSFPDLMSRFCDHRGGKPALLRKIKARFDNIRSFPELYKAATQFHRELGTLFPIENIITTNWDDYFERECGATPFVTAADFVFWDLPGRKVFKIHGSVNNFGAIVATREDYERCYEDDLLRGLLGSNLKMMLATKTILYAGFSFKDDDFLRIQNFLSKEMHGLRPQSYIVTIDRESDARFREMGLHPIYTDAAFFLAGLKKRLLADGHMIEDERLDGIVEFWLRVKEVHSEATKIDIRRNPGVIYCWAYQDGLHHALGRIMTMRDAGLYSHSCHIKNTVAAYLKSRREKMRERSFSDVAYIDGYIDGHLYLLASDDERAAFPTYYVFGYEGALRSNTAFRKVLSKASSIHKRAHSAAEKLVRTTGVKKGTVLHHPALL